MITISVESTILLALKMGWDYNWSELYKALDHFYKTHNITLSAAIGHDNYLNLSWDTDELETLFRLKYSEHL